MTSPVQQIIANQRLTNVAAALYTSPAGVWTQIVALGCLNTDTSTRQVTIYVVPNGGSVAAATLTTSALGLLPGGNYNGQNEYGMVLNPGDAIWGFASTTLVVNILASGLINT